LIEQGPRLNFWRAPTDNDRGWQNYERSWREAGLDQLQHRTDGVEIATTEEGVAVTARVRIAPPKFTHGITAEYLYLFTPDGYMELRVAGEFKGQWPATIPRIGLQLHLPRALEQVGWYGLGPGESYIDSRQAARVGFWQAGVDTLHTPYVFPQENGNRHETRWVRFAAPQGYGLQVQGDSYFDFSSHRYTPEDFERARHTTDLVARPDIVVHLDHKQHGLGSNSCGPIPLPQHRLAPDSFSFRLLFQAAKS
jgi:beta-galactosidase/evolved beta-galactosidase subunit alpha